MKIPTHAHLEEKPHNVTGIENMQMAVLIQ